MLVPSGVVGPRSWKALTHKIHRILSSEEEGADDVIEEGEEEDE
jgi:hypothetical protein